MATAVRLTRKVGRFPVGTVRRYDDVSAARLIADGRGVAASAPVEPIFDPNDKTVVEVNAYLDDADESERERVLDAERDGKARVSIID